MDTNITFRMDQNIKAQMAEICHDLGMSPSTAFNLFANAFVRAKGMPFPITLQKDATPTVKQMLADTDDFLSGFAEDYKRMAE